MFFSDCWKRIARVQKGLTRHCLFYFTQEQIIFTKCTDKKEKQIFLINREVQSGAVAKSYMTKGLLTYDLIFAHFLMYLEALPHM
jgi:hypothetical protein